jgi:hypothetical protein
MRSSAGRAGLYARNSAAGVGEPAPTCNSGTPRLGCGSWILRRFRPLSRGKGARRDAIALGGLWSTMLRSGDSSSTRRHKLRARSKSAGKDSGKNDFRQPSLVCCPTCIRHAATNTPGRPWESLFGCPQVHLRSAAIGGAGRTECQDSRHPGCVLGNLEPVPASVR